LKKRLEDYRFHSIQEKLSQGKISEDEAYKESSALLDAYNTYISMKKKLDSKQLADYLLNHQSTQVLLQEIDPYLSGDFFPKAVPANGFKPNTASYKGPVTPDQKQALFNLVFAKMDLQARLTVWFGNPPNIPKAGKEEATAYDQIANAPYTKGLIVMKPPLEPGQLVYLLQEDIERRVRFGEWQVMGVTRLQCDGHGYSDQPLTDANIQAETLSLLSSNSSRQTLPWIDITTCP
jgi:hypothetical protein